MPPPTFSLTETIRTLIFTVPLQNGPEEAQCLKILAACNLAEGDYLLVNEAQDYRYFRSHKNIKEVIMFGVTEQQLALSLKFPYNYCLPFDGKVFIKTQSIPELMRNNTLKNELWQKALKPHFHS